MRVCDHVTCIPVNNKHTRPAEHEDDDIMSRRSCYVATGTAGNYSDSQKYEKNLYTQIIARGYIDLNEEAIVQIRLLRAVEGFIADWSGISGGVMGQMRVKRG